MKKLLFLLLFPFLAFSQSRIDYTAVNSPTQVGDTLVVKFQYFKGDGADATLTQFDFQFNNKLLSYIGHEFQVASTSAQKARNSWNGYKFTPDSTKEQTDFDGQYTSLMSSTASYPTNADWSIERITVQDATPYPNEAEFVKYSFKIKDKGLTNYSDYSSVINVNWANYKQSNGTLINVTGQSNLSLSNIKGGDAGSVALNLSTNVITNNIGDGTHYSYTIYTEADWINGIDQNTTVVASGNFDASGQAVIQGLENDTPYYVSIVIDNTQTYLDEVVTVSDLALIFQEAIGAGSTPGGQTTTFDYALQKFLGNVTQPTGVDFQDSYEVLAYINGVDSGNTPWITKSGQAFNISGAKATFGDKNAEGTATWSQIFTPTDNNKSFDFVHALNGDVNFSHSFQPQSALAMNVIAQSKSFSINQAKYQPEISNLDLVSQIIDGQVEFSINVDTPDMIGAQFNIEYDTTKLVLENVVFDTGNDMTNFSNLKPESGKVNIGSFDQNFQYTIKSGTPYKLIFTPTQQLDNTLGLITFKVTEGVKADGSQVKFQIN